jgi:alpha-L-fucosidase 2
MNLQGIWADGLLSMWNGDYHLNINLQMAYWGANAAALPETLRLSRCYHPCITLIARIPVARCIP